jgi:hypothetical protein
MVEGYSVEEGQGQAEHPCELGHSGAGEALAASCVWASRSFSLFDLRAQGDLYLDGKPVLRTGVLFGKTPKGMRKARR